MADVRAKYVPPAIDQLSFNCPHCGALAKQTWFSIRLDQFSRNSLPPILDQESAKTQTFENIDNPEYRTSMKKWALQMAAERPFTSEIRGDKRLSVQLFNVSVSICFSCDDVAIWIYDRLVWPQRGDAPVPNGDLPDDVRRDYDEAGTILANSPRGAAALLRLSIQKLCGYLGEKGKNIDEDIASLVKKGLDPRVQQALDVVRVIGNNAVHPGQIDLTDDRATAEELFALVNLISDIMISQPKHVSEMYDRLPERARKAIEKRDGR